MRTLDVDINEKDRVITIKRGNGFTLILNLSTELCSFEGDIVISSKEIENNILLPYTAVLIKE